MTDVLVDTLLYKPMFAVIETTENSVTVYDFFNQKLKSLKLKSDKSGDNYFRVNSTIQYLRFLFPVNELAAWLQLSKYTHLSYGGLKSASP